ASASMRGARPGPPRQASEYVPALVAAATLPRPHHLGELLLLLRREPRPHLEQRPQPALLEVRARRRALVGLREPRVPAAPRVREQRPQLLALAAHLRAQRAPGRPGRVDHAEDLGALRLVEPELLDRALDARTLAEAAGAAGPRVARETEPEGGRERGRRGERRRAQSQLANHLDLPPGSLSSPLSSPGPTTGLAPFDPPPLDPGYPAPRSGAPRQSGRRQSGTLVADCLLP